MDQETKENNETSFFNFVWPKMNNPEGILHSLRMTQALAAIGFISYSLITTLIYYNNGTSPQLYIMMGLLILISVVGYLINRGNYNYVLLISLWMIYEGGYKVVTLLWAYSIGYQGSPASGLIGGLILIWACTGLRAFIKYRQNKKEIDELDLDRKSKKNTN